MKKVVLLLVLLSMFVLSGCAKSSEEEMSNRMFPLELEENEQQIVDFITAPDYAVLLSTSLNETVKWATCYVEVYNYGELIYEQFGGAIGFDDNIGRGLEIAITSRKIGSWDIHFKNENSIASFELNVEDAIEEEESPNISAFLNYEVPITINEPQIIAVYFFDNTATAFTNSLFEENSIDDIEDYEYVYVLKAKFSDETKKY